MTPRIRRSSSRILLGAAIGAVAGIAAGLVMNQVHAIWSAFERASDGPQPAAKPATVKAAEALVGPVDERAEGRAGSIAHFVMSGVTGAIYGAASSVLSPVAIGRGLGWGAGVWLVADEIVVPLVGLAKPPWKYPVKTHVRALLAHLAYGAALDAGVRGAMRVLG